MLGLYQRVRGLQAKSAQAFTPPYHVHNGLVRVVTPEVANLYVFLLRKCRLAKHVSIHRAVSIAPLDGSCFVFAVSDRFNRRLKAEDADPGVEFCTEAS